MSGVWLASYIVLWLVVLVLAFLLAGALRQLGLMQLRLGDDPGALITDTGLERGDRGAGLHAVESEIGELVTLSGLERQAAGARLRLARLPLVPGADPGPERGAQDAAGEFDFLVVCRGDVESCQGFGRMNRLEAPMVVDTNGQIEKDYHVTLTPFAYLLDHEGNVVIRGIANDWRQLESLLEQEGTLQSRSTWVEVDGDGDGPRPSPSRGRADGHLDARAAQALARRSSRRQFFKFLGAGSLGAGPVPDAAPTSRSGAVTGCVGCGGGPCNPCGSPVGTLRPARARRRISARPARRAAAAPMAARPPASGSAA